MDNEELLTHAKEASLNAYAPYSKCKVGACVLFENNNFYTGCNVENASYGLTLCAERNAISTAIANGEKSKLEAVAIYCKSESTFLPCGACRQWFVEFGLTDNFRVIIQDKNEKIHTYKIDELLPNSFELKF